MENLSFVSTHYYQLANTISLFAIVLIVATSYIGSQVIPPDARVPMQFGINGKPNWFAARWVALIFVPICGVVYIASLWMMTRDGSGTRPNHELIMFVVRSLTAGLFVLVHAFHLFFAARYVARQTLSRTT